MKKRTIFIILFFPFLVFSQNFNSWDGAFISPHNSFRTLNIFINFIYDVHPEINDNFTNEEYWLTVTDTLSEGINNVAIPTYLLDFIDTVYNKDNLQGSLTKLYGESSFDSLQIILPLN